MTESITAIETTKRAFHITVMGRTLEHLGVQMYKRRDIAIAELVANSWDAGATRVDVIVPEEQTYDPATSMIVILDDGLGMNDDQVQHEYLVIGRNRRLSDAVYPPQRPVMGRKGIGKLAGFGVASEMSVTTWKDERSTTLTLDVHNLKLDAGAANQVRLFRSCRRWHYM